MSHVAASSSIAQARRSPDSAFTVARLLEQRGVVIAAVWMVPALLAASETYLFWRLGGRDYPFWRAVVMEGPAWAVYALLTPIVFALGRRVPLQRSRLMRNLAAHLTVSLSAGLSHPRGRAPVASAIVCTTSCIRVQTH